MLNDHYTQAHTSPISWSYVPDSGVFYSSPELLKELNLTQHTPLQLDELLTYFTPTSALLFQQALQRTLAKAESTEIPLKFQDEPEKSVHCYIQALYSGANLHGIQGQFYFMPPHLQQDLISHELLRYQTIFDKAQTGIAYGDATGHIIDCNPYFCKLLGYTLDEITQQSFRDFTYFEDLAQENELILKLSDGYIDSYRLEKRYVHANGEIIWVDATITALRNQDNKVLNYIGMVTNISARKEAEFKLSEQGDFLDTLLGFTEDLVVIVNEQGSLLRVWSSQAEQFSIQLDTLIGKRVHDIASPELAQLFDQSIQQALKEETNVYIETPVKLEKDRWYLAKYRALPKQPGHVLRQILITGHDITSQKQAEHRLENFQEQLQQLNRITFDSHLLDEKRILHALKHTLTYLGMNQALIFLFQETPTPPPLYCYPEHITPLPDSFFKTLQNWPQMLNHNLTLPDNWCYQLPTDKHLPTLIAHPFRTGKGIQGTIVFSDTGTEVIELNTYQLQFLRILSQWIGDILEKKKQVDQLEALNTNQERILSILSHDLRNSLSSVIGFCQVIKRHNMAAPKTLQLIDRIQNAGNNAHQLLQEILTVQELEGSRIEKGFGVHSLNAILESVLLSFTAQAREKGIEFVYTPLEQSPELHLHRIWFSRLVENLLSNALKFTPSDGSIHLNIKEEGSGVCLIVKDTGIGIPENLQSLIFKKFSEARRPGVRGEVSTGMGMYIIEQIVRMHQGEIWFESQENQGTCFYVLIPQKVS